jgi:hypothetical protein
MVRRAEIVEQLRERLPFLDYRLQVTFTAPSGARFDLERFMPIDTRPFLIRNPDWNELVPRRQF